MFISQRFNLSQNDIKRMETGKCQAPFNCIKNWCAIAYFTASRSTISSTGSLASNSEAFAIKAFAISPFK